MMSATALFPQLRTYIEKRMAEADSIPQHRKLELNELTRYIRGKLARNQPVALNFICTHNSRRSHLTQIWSAVSALFFGVKNIHTFSGGTEATAFNHRAVAALKRAGFEVNISGAENPKYEMRFNNETEPLICFSKKYGDPRNPSEKFAAIMTCSSADAGCPVVFGAECRIAIKYRDPKEADNTPEESKVYDERCAQIAREMVYVFQQVK